MMFNKPVTQEIYNANKKLLLSKNFKLNLNETYDYKKTWANLWATLSTEDKNFFKTLTNFDSDIFKEITGIDINEKTYSKEVTDAIEVLKNADMIQDGKIINLKNLSQPKQ